MSAFDGKFIDNGNITINLNKNGLKEGLHFGKISFHYGSNFKDTLTLKVSTEVHQLELLPERLDTLFFSNQNKLKEFYIRNNGCNKFDFCIKAGNKAIICKPQKATIAPHDSIKISVAINGNFLYEGDNVFNISIEDLKHNKILNLPVKVFYLNGEESEIGKNVVEADYSKTNDLLLIIAKNPNEIRFYDTKIKKKQAIQLAHEPNNLSISPDGNFTLVSSYKTLYYIDIKKQEIIQEFHIPVDCFDIALSDNKWAYFTPRFEQFYIEDTKFKKNKDSLTMYALNLDNGEFTSVEQLSKHSEIIKIHPSGKYLFTASHPSMYLPNGRFRNHQELSSVFMPPPQNPDTLKKFDIRNGTPKFISSSDFPAKSIIGRNFWFTDNGSKIVTYDNYVIQLSENADENFKLNGKLLSKRKVEFVDYSTTINKTLVIQSNDDWKNLFYELTIYDMYKIETPQKISFPIVHETDSRGKLEYFRLTPRFCFFNSDGTKLIIVLEAGITAYGWNEWKMVLLDLQL